MDEYNIKVSQHLCQAAIFKKHFQVTVITRPQSAKLAYHGIIEVFE